MPPSGYRDSDQHLDDELRKLDLLVQRRVLELRLQARDRFEAGADPSRALFVSHEEVDGLLDDHTGPDPAAHPAVQAVAARAAALQAEIDTRVARGRRRRVHLALPRLAERFGLSPSEAQAVVVCLAPELDRKYDRLYAYLQDDITRKRPSVELVLDLTCGSEQERRRALACFAPQAPLLRSAVLAAVHDPNSPSGSSGLAQFLQLEPRVLAHLLGDDRIDGRLAGAAEVHRPDRTTPALPVDQASLERLRRLVRGHLAAKAPPGGRPGLVVHLRGPYGAGKRELARLVCAELDLPVVEVDLELLGRRRADPGPLLVTALREGRLLDGAVHLHDLDALERREQPRAELKCLVAAVEEHGWLTFLSGGGPWPLPGAFRSASFHTLPLPAADVPLRRRAWEWALAPLAAADPSWAGQLASRYRLTPGQIRDAALSAAGRLVLDGEDRAARLGDLSAACRRVSQHTLGELAVKLDPRYGWDDIVLPDAKLAHLRELCAQATHAHTVFGDWGFGRRIAHGRGLSVLFFGPPGTGKTMAAEVVARELGLDLFKVDLAQVVSKYIGETEKNLARIFQEAEAGNAILFFDEADALFGKRTEIGDAHDRYANLEISYLLQKMDEYEGVSILASNLRENMDEAFTRRIRCIVELPFPDEASRRRLWEAHFPDEAPVSAAIDCGLLASRFRITGGSIRNVVLHAAFQAADDGGVITMDHVLHGVRREFEKLGKLWQEQELGAAAGPRG